MALLHGFELFLAKVPVYNDLIQFSHICRAGKRTRVFPLDTPEVVELLESTERDSRMLQEPPGG